MPPVHDRYRRADEFMTMIADRRSVMPKRMGAPGPTREEIEAMLDAALTAPDHNQLRPWRVALISHEGRDDLAEAFLAGRRRRKGDQAVTAEDIEREYDKARQPPSCLRLSLA